MLEHLRKMSPEAKKKVGIYVAGAITFLIFCFWILRWTGGLSATLETTKRQGVAVFGFLDQNVEKAYNAFQNNVPKFTSTTTTSEEIETTTPNEIEQDEFLTGQAEN